MPHVPLILLVEDDDDDYFLTRDAFQEAHIEVDLRRVKNGEELLDYLLHRGQFQSLNGSSQPVVILLDLNMPRKDGREALREIKSDPALKGIPVVVLTTSKDQEDLEGTYELGGNSFIRKPSSFSKFVDIVGTIKKYWLDTVEVPSHSLTAL